MIQFPSLRGILKGQWPLSGRSGGQGPPAFPRSPASPLRLRAHGQHQVQVVAVVDGGDDAGGDAGVEVSPTAEEVEGFNTYIENYKAGLPIEEAAVRFKCY